MDVKKMVKSKLGLDGGIKGKILDCITSTTESFASGFLNQYKVSVVKHAIAEGEAAANAKADDGKQGADQARQLQSPPGDSVPSKEGFVEKQSAVLKRWRKLYVKVKPNCDLSFSTAADKPEEFVINLWGYKVGAINERPQGKRKGGPKWVDDADRPACKACNAAFTMVARRHHCRACGEVFCGNCTEQEVNLAHFGYHEPQRVCGECFKEYNVRIRAQSIMVPDATTPENQKEEFFGIQLLHKRRTPYVFCVASEQERQEWISVISVCCKNAGEPRNANPVMAESFEAAHRQAALDGGMPGPWELIGSEEEMMAALLMNNLEKQVIAAQIDEIAAAVPEKFRKKAVALVRKQVAVLVNGGVGPAWRKISKLIEEKSKPIQDAITPQLAKLGDARATIKNKVKDKVMSGVSPLVDKVSGPIFNKVMPMIQSAVFDCYFAAFKVFKDEAKEVADKVAAASGDKHEAFKTELGNALKHVQAETKEMKEVYVASKAFAKELREARKEHDVLSHIEAGPIADRVVISIHKLLAQALYTLSVDEKLVANLSADAAGAIKGGADRTVPKLVNDAAVELNDVLKGIVIDLVMHPLSEAVQGNSTISELCTPLEELIPDFAKEFLSITDTRDEIISETVEGMVDKVVSKGFSSIRSKLESGAKA